METIDNHNIYADADIERAARCLKAMSHPLRLKILCVLGTEAISVLETQLLLHHRQELVLSVHFLMDYLTQLLGKHGQILAILVQGIIIYIA
jgi:DNA-binding transcriptional ArsR family regulator